MTYFWSAGFRKAVVVDDLLPYWEGQRPGYMSYKKRKTINTGMSKNGAWWLPILEKSFSKQFGSYEQTASGQEIQALRAMTNLPVTDHEPDKMGGPDKVFDFVTKHDKAQAAMTTGCCNDSYGKLYGGHAYTMLGTVKLSNGVRLMKIRNPWGSEVYRGAWHDKDPAWTPAFKKEANLVVANDGVFHIPVEQYVKTFDTLTIAEFKNWKRHAVHTSTKKQKAALVYMLEPKKASEITVTVDFKSSRMYGPGTCWNKEKKNDSVHPYSNSKNYYWIKIHDQTKFHKWNYFYKRPIAKDGCSSGTGYGMVRFNVKAGGKYMVTIMNYGRKSKEWDIPMTVQTYSTDEEVKL